MSRKSPKVVEPSRLRVLREGLRLSRREFGVIIGVDHTSVSSAELKPAKSRTMLALYTLLEADPEGMVRVLLRSHSINYVPRTDADVRALTCVARRFLGAGYFVWLHNFRLKHPRVQV